MTKEQFEREKNYQVSMYIVRNMLERKLIGIGEYEKISKGLIRKYRPLIGSLNG
jgi:hypothetical protein